MTATDVFTGWTQNVAIKNRAHRWVVEAIDLLADTVPYPMAGLDCDKAGSSSTTSSWPGAPSGRSS